MFATFLYCSVIIFVYATTWFAISVYKKRNDVADIAWGIGYIIICGFLFITYPASPVLNTLYALVTLWGLRLSLHIYTRNKNKPEDYRYKAWREQWGKTFYWRSYIQVFLLQGFFLLVIISPVIHAAASAWLQCNVFTWTGLCCWMVGFYFQAVADWQLAVFKSHPKNKGLIIQTGLWKYSRHPNYFGEILMWWSIFIITLPFTNSLYFIVSPLTITFLLVFVSGIPMLEKKYKGNAAFEDYKNRTSALIPMPPGKKQ
jgi:steroid 5-alpha reductase family enzyme